MGIREGSLGYEFLRGSTCAEEMGCGRRWVRRVLRGTGTARGFKECLGRFHRRCVDYLSRQFLPKWDSPNGEGELATTRIASLLVELECVAA